MENLQGTKQHAVFSASGSYRWLQCAGSIKLSEKAPPQRESEYAVEGTRAHECLEYLINGRADLKNTIKKASKHFTSEQIENTLIATNWVLDRLGRIKDGILLCETKVDASPFTCEGQFGTLDLSIIQEFGKLTVIDYKNGQGVLVDPKDNPQLIYYALGISHQYNHNFAEVELVIIQPRAFHDSGETVRTHTMSMNELLKWQGIFRKGVEECENPNASLTAGDWCRFCPAAPICPEIKNKAMKQAMVAFDDDKGLVEELPEPKSIAIPKLGMVLDACDKLDAWMSRVREHALHVLERGEKVEGFKLVQKRSTRKWTDIDDATEIARTLFGGRAFTVPELLSPAQIEKAFPKSNDAKLFIQDQVSSISSGVTIARDTDKRPEVNLIESNFSEVNPTTGKEI